MTVKEAMTTVFENRDEFPLGWDTSLQKVYTKSGKVLYEKRQKWVFVLTIKTPYNHEGDTVTIFRDKAKAKDAMEEDIRETFAVGNPRFDPDDLVREDDEHAHLGDEIDWSIESMELIA